MSAPFRGPSVDPSPAAGTGALHSVLHARLLVVDDEPANVLLLERIVRRAGYTEVRSTTDSRTAMAHVSEFRPDIVLLDLNMPFVDGFALLGEIARAVPEGSYLPVLVLTANVSRDARERALSSGAHDFVTKPFDPAEVLLRIRNLLQTRFLHLGLEAQLRHAQKLEVIGRLTSGIAHDFNNLLTSIRGNAQLLLMEAPEGDPAREDLREIDDAVDRAVALIRQLMAFSRKQPPEMREVHLNAVIAGLRNTLLRLLGNEVRLQVSADPALGPVLADPGQVEQVIMNLVVNARDAMPGGGTLTIATRNDGAEALLSIGDTGVGIPPEARDRIFEPFFTTKDEGQGTGLGLSIVSGIVEQSRGRIEVASDAGRGTTFTLAFPRVEPAAPASAPAAAEHGGLVGGTEAVLVVDADERVRAVLRKVLFRAGYRVFEARGAREALDFARDFAGAIDLLVAGLHLPGMDGVELSHRLASERPSLRTLLLGMEGEGVPAGGAPGRAVLRMPFTPHALGRSVRDLLAEAAP
ncbi:hybrid sensor histidine kinase/response regulator [Longimicrobium sp.]|jgi:signal transduction histidine kinase|uniref:hybrid sensor histidine kinase/response regulator n=1 Tax=Longimicrobium sp. TaxID=2029185 RepID=UPI002F94E529